MPEPGRLRDGTGTRLSGPIDLLAPARPTFREPGAPCDAELRGAIEARDPESVTRAAGALLAHIADRLSWTRGMSIVRGRGDGSLEDRWPSVANALRRTDADDIVEQVTRSPLFRTLVAPKGDGLPTAVSMLDAKRFGEAVLSLLGHTRCADCEQWWSAAPAGASPWTCRCRSLVVASRRNTR